MKDTWKQCTIKYDVLKYSKQEIEFGIELINKMKFNKFWSLSPV